MQEVISVICAPHEARPDRRCGFVVAASPVITKVQLRSPMPIEIVGKGAAKSLSHIRYLEGNGIAGVGGGCRNRAARMQPLISRKYVKFWSRVALRERATRNE